MKKTAILTLLMTLLLAAIMTCGATSGAEAEWSLPATTMASMVTEWSGEATVTEAESTESTSAETSAGTSAAAAETQASAAQAQFSASMTAAKTVAAAPPPAIAVQSTSPITTTAAPAAISAPVPATAAWTTTTTTRYIPPETTTTTTTTTTHTTTTTQYVPPATTTTTAPATQPKSDYETMGQTLYQAKVVDALNSLRAEKSLPPMATDPALMAHALAQAQKMAAAGRAYHSEEIHGFEAVGRAPYLQPAYTMGYMLAHHVADFLVDSAKNVGVAVVRSGNDLYAVMIGN